MDQTTHRVEPGFVWPTVGHPGRAPTWSIAPNPNQPRKEAGFDDEELDSLADTMRPENGGEQREIITVRQIHKSERELYDSAVCYLLISGERRWRSAQRAGLLDLEIRVKRYDSQADEEFDMYMLNEKRVGLSDIENAEYLARIMRNYNLKTQEELAEKVGKQQTEISMFLSLLKLSPKARAKMSPRVPEYIRIRRQVGVYLSHFDHDVQDDFVDRMPQDRATVAQQIAWMQTELKDKAIELPARRENPGTMRQILGYFTGAIERRSLEIAGKKNIDRLFENTKPGQINELLGKLGDAEYEFNELLKKVRQLAGVEEVPRPEEPAQRIQPAPQLPKPAVDNFLRDKVQVHQPPARRQVSAPVYGGNIGKEAPRAASPTAYAQGAHAKVEVNRPKPVPKEQPELTIGCASPPLTYHDKRKRGWVRDKRVDWGTYMALWRDEKLEFQMLERAKPENLPTLQEVQEALAGLRK